MRIVNNTLIVLLCATFWVNAQRVVSEEVSISFMGYPYIAVEQLMSDSIEVRAVKKKITEVYDRKVLSKKAVCQPKGGELSDAQLLDQFYYTFKSKNSILLVASDARGTVLYADRVYEDRWTQHTFGTENCYWTEKILSDRFEREKEVLWQDLSALSEVERAAVTNGANRFTQFKQNYVGTEVFYVGGRKKKEYADLNQAKDAAVKAYGLLQEDVDSGEGHQLLSRAISIWEQALAEAGGKRITQKIATNLKFNIIMTSFVTKDFKKGIALCKELLQERNMTEELRQNRMGTLKFLLKEQRGYETNKSYNVDYPLPKFTYTLADPDEFGELNRVTNSFMTDNPELFNTNSYLTGDTDPSSNENSFEDRVTRYSTGNYLTLPSLLERSQGTLLDSIPKEVFELKDLTHLILRGNRLTTIPVEIGQLNQLVKLDLANNQLSDLPEELGGLQQLKTLILKGNNIDEAVIERLKVHLKKCKIKY